MRFSGHLGERHGVPEALADYLRAVHDSDTIHAMCDDYWADDVRGRGLDCGHYLAEEKADDIYAELKTFFTS